MPSVRRLSARQVLFIHDQVIEESGGSHGVRDEHGLRSAVERPDAGFDKRRFYPTLFTMAAALMHSLISNHPFVDGNKRTGVAAAGVFLELNGWELRAPGQALEDYAVQIATASPSIEAIAEWLESHSVPRD